jgi:hypothetical protein
MNLCPELLCVVWRMPMNFDLELFRLLGGEFTIILNMNFLLFCRREFKRIVAVIFIS